MAQSKKHAKTYKTARMTQLHIVAGCGGPRLAASAALVPYGRTPQPDPGPIRKWARSVGGARGDALAGEHGVDEAVEEGRGVVWARGGLGVVLDGEDVASGNVEAGDGVVVEVPVGDAGAPGLEAGGVDGEAVVLAGDLDASGEGVEDGLVGAAVAELELVGGGAEGEGEELVAQADAEGGDVGVAFEEEVAEGGDRAFDGGGVARAVGDEQAVGLPGVEDGGEGVGGGVVGDEADRAAALGEVAEDVSLGAAVEGDDGEGGAPSPPSSPTTPPPPTPSSSTWPETPPPMEGADLASHVAPSDESDWTEPLGDWAHSGAAPAG